jgi:hypothetical protein
MARLRENAVVDANQNFENVALFGGVACGHKVLRRPPAEDIAWRIHPTARFGFFAEDLKSAIPDGVSAWVLKLF